MSKYAIHCKACHQALLAAADSERRAFSLAVQSAARKPILQTAFGEYEVLAVTPNWDYRCRPAGSNGQSERTFCGCNDGDWASLLAQVNVSRHPRWAR
jgi:hypothetical protein